jgi:hypothetical protein
MQMMQAGTSSYLCWARIISNLTGRHISKQAIHLRMNDAWVATIKSLVSQTVQKQITRHVKPALFASFKNVWLQDSTSLALPKVMYETYRCSQVKGKRKSVAKLNIITNVLNGYCALMDWKSFTTSEVTLGKYISQIATKGDLVIRDLGYFALSFFRDLDTCGIYFLTKLRYGVLAYSIQGELLDLKQLLANREYLDMDILCGNAEKLKIRLVAIRLPQQVINERRRQAKKHKSSTTKHHELYYEMLDYVIFITNVGNDRWNYKQVSEAYRIRWNIEIIFKSWKSGLRIEKIIPVDKVKKERIESFLYLTLLYITWFNTLLYYPLKLKLLKQKKQVSILKLAAWARLWPNWYLNPSQTIKLLYTQLTYYCCYETRAGRMNNQLKLYAP